MPFPIDGVSFERYCSPEVGQGKEKRMKKKVLTALFVGMILSLGAHGALSQEGRTESAASLEKEAKPLVRVQLAEEVLADYPEHDEFIADRTEPQVKVALLAEGEVRDFKVLSLHLKDVDADGKPNFLVVSLHTRDRLTPGRPLVVGLTFYGSTPHYGISYIDESGTERCFSLDQSGMDDSIYLSEF